MYNRQYFEHSKNFTVYGNFGIQYWSKDDRFDNDDVKKIVHRYNCNHVYGYIYDNGTCELYPKFKDNMHTMILHNKQFFKLYEAMQKGDIRAKVLYNGSYKINYNDNVSALHDGVYRIDYCARDLK